jgi:putative membrane protein
MVVLGLAGAALFIVLLVKHHVGEIALAIARAGWALVAILAVHAVQLVPETLAWFVLLPRDKRPRALYWISWIGESVNALLPLTQIGGDIVRARLAIKHGIPAPLAASTVLVDVTMSVVAQVVYSLIGLALLIVVTGSSSLTVPALAGSLLLLAGVAGFWVVQRYGLFRLLAALINRLARSSSWHDLIEQGQAFDEQVRSLYAQPRRLIANGCFTFACWLISAVEVWIALRALGIRAGYAEALILESVSRAVRSAMFLVPGALGLQEGGYVVVGRLLGIGGETAMALALIRRVRELAVGVPALVYWQWIEGRLFWRRRNRSVARKPGVAAAERDSVPSSPASPA